MDQTHQSGQEMRPSPRRTGRKLRVDPKSDAQTDKAPEKSETSQLACAIDNRSKWLATLTWINLPDPAAV